VKEDISEGGDVEEVDNIVVLLDINVEGFILESLIGEYRNGGKEAVHPGIKSFGQKQQVVLHSPENHLAVETYLPDFFH
jgi:hypothetical protein